MGRIDKRIIMFKEIVEMIKRKNGEKKAKQEAFQQEVEAMFPTMAHAHTAERMREMLPQGDLGTSQYQWHDNVTHPYQLSPPQWNDMMWTQEGLNPEQVNQLHSDYYKMNNLPDIMNTQKNIDILIRAASFENYEDYE